MIFATLLAILPFFDTAVGGAGLYHELHPQTWGQLTPDTPEWKAACMNAFPKSFNKDDGTWKDMHGVYHACRIKIVHKW